MGRAREDGFAARWSWFEETHVLPWLKARGGRSSGRAIAGALGVTWNRIFKWRNGSTPDRFELERIAELVGAPAPQHMAAWLVTGVGDRRAPAQLDDRADPRRVAEEAKPAPAAPARDRAIAALERVETAIAENEGAREALAEVRQLLETPKPVSVDEVLEVIERTRGGEAVASVLQAVKARRMNAREAAKAIEAMVRAGVAAIVVSIAAGGSNDNGQNAKIFREQLAEWAGLELERRRRAS